MNQDYQYVTYTVVTCWLCFDNSKEYRKEILFPVMQFISRQHGQPELYEGLISDLDPLAMPRGASEMEVKMRQVCVANV